MENCVKTKKRNLFNLSTKNIIINCLKNVLHIAKKQTKQKLYINST